MKPEPKDSFREMKMFWTFGDASSIWFANKFQGRSLYKGDSKGKGKGFGQGKGKSSRKGKGGRPYFHPFKGKGKGKGKTDHGKTGHANRVAEEPVAQEGDETEVPEEEALAARG